MWTLLGDLVVLFVAVTAAIWVVVGVSVGVPLAARGRRRDTRKAIST